MQNINLGTKIRELRKKKGITQDALANALSVSPQAVSKWENGIALPDIALTPSIASYFGVTMDELFEFDIRKSREKALEIVKETWPLRESDPEKGRRIIYDALKQYPENDILLENLLYLIDHSKEPDETIDIALRTMSATEDDSIKYDALRFLAYAYKARGDLESAKAALDRISDLFFTRLSEMAGVLSGEEKRIAAEKQRGVSIELLCEMQERIAEDMIEKGQVAEAKKEYEKALKLLEIFEANGDYWDSYKKHFAEKAASPTSES